MENSILKSVKKNLGMAPDYLAFDQDILMFINSAFSTLEQLGLGPGDFIVEDETQEWDEFIDPGDQQNSVKTFVYLSVRLIFDPPVTSFTIIAFEKQLEELTWRLNTRREGTEWADPSPPPLLPTPSIFDYGI